MANVAVLVSDERIQYDGLFDLGELYKHAYNWLVWRKFDVNEKKYSEKSKGPVKDITIEWDIIKIIDEYSQYSIAIKWEPRGIGDVDVKKDSGTAKMQKGEVSIWISASVKTDRQEFWTQNAFMSFMRTFYDRYLYRSTYEKLRGDMWKTAMSFKEEMKSFLTL